eukprot:CFRG3577T1
MKLFSKAKKAPPASESIQNLRQTQDMLSKRQTHLNKKISDELDTAKRLNKAGNKKGALQALKRKKQYEVHADRIDGTLNSLEAQILAIEGASMNKLAFDALRNGAATMKKEQNNMKLEDIDNVMDDVQEQMEVADEIGQALSQGFGNSMYDDDELLNELEELEALEMDGELESTPVSFPDVPSAVPQKAQAQKTPEDDELAQLGAMMNY